MFASWQDCKVVISKDNFMHVYQQEKNKKGE